MPIISIAIPENCKDCALLNEEIINHAYYGETTEKCICRVFGCPIKGYERCEECKSATTQADDIRKYADYLVNKVNNLLGDQK